MEPASCCSDTLYIFLSLVHISIKRISTSCARWRQCAIIFGQASRQQHLLCRGQVSSMVVRLASSRSTHRFQSFADFISLSNVLHSQAVASRWLLYIIGDRQTFFTQDKTSLKCMTRVARTSSSCDSAYILAFHEKVIGRCRQEIGGGTSAFVSSVTTAMLKDVFQSA